MFHYSLSTKGFYDSRLHGDNVPSDSVQLTGEEYSILKDGLSAGKIIEIDLDGLLTLRERQQHRPTREQIEAARLRAYADPLTGSDRYFAEATRLQVIGGTAEEIDSAKAAGAARYAEIQAQYPWP